MTDCNQIQLQPSPLQAEEVQFPLFLLASPVPQPPAHPDGPALESLQLLKTCLLGSMKLDAASSCSLSDAKQRRTPTSVDLLARCFLVQVGLQVQCTVYRKSLVAITRCFNIWYIQGGDPEPKQTNST